MAAFDHFDLCVVGAGAAGLTVAAGGALMGARVALIERDRMGGDCLNHGCVPSKALLAAAKAAHGARAAAGFGVDATPVVDGARVYAHVRRTIDGIAPNDSVARFAGLGVTVIAGAARFVDPRTLIVGERRLTARRFVVATGSRPRLPPIPGLAESGCLTNETIFDREALPERLIVLGGGPIGVEMAQAHARLGVAVTLIEAARLLPREDADLVALVRRTLVEEGVRLIEGAAASSVARATSEVRVALADGREVVGTDLLVAVGRRPATADLDLAAAGVELAGEAIRVDRGLRSSNRRVFAAGDVAAVDGAAPAMFTHVAGYHAGVVLKRALFHLPAKVDMRAMPRATYCDPELAAVGLSEEEAVAQGLLVDILRWPLGENDRARAERSTQGMVKALIGPRGRILGAAILATHAGDLIQQWTMAIAKRLPIGAMAEVVAPYPTLGEASKRAAGSWYTPRLFTPRTRRIVRFVQRFG